MMSQYNNPKGEEGQFDYLCSDIGPSFSYLGSLPTYLLTYLVTSQLPLRRDTFVGRHLYNWGMHHAFRRARCSFASLTIPTKAHCFARRAMAMAMATTTQTGRTYNVMNHHSPSPIPPFWADLS